MEGGCGCTGGCEEKGSPEMMGKIISAAIILLMMLILWFIVLRPSILEKQTTSESYIGNSLAETYIYTSGATLRRLGQLFTSTNQGVQTTIYNADANGKDVALNVIIYPVVSS